MDLKTTVEVPVGVIASRSKYFSALRNDVADLGGIEDVLKASVCPCSGFARWVYDSTEHTKNVLTMR